MPDLNDELEFDDDEPLPEELEIVYSSLPDSPELDGLSLDFEAPPEKPVRATREKKVVLAWEEYLAFLVNTPGRWARLYEFSADGDSKEAAKRARVRARTINTRLKKTQPAQIWEVVAVEGRDSQNAPTGLWKVHTRFVRPATPQELTERLEAAQRAAERAKHAAAARSAQREATSAA